jgi:hypothetical protein
LTIKIAAAETRLLVITVADLQDSAYTVSDLEPNSKYVFVIESLTIAGVSVSSVSVNVTTSNDNNQPLSAKAFVSIAIGSCFALSLMIIGCISMIKLVCLTLLFIFQAFSDKRR